MDLEGKSLIGALAKKVATFSLFVRELRRGGWASPSTGSKRRLTTAMVVGVQASWDPGGGS